MKYTVITSLYNQLHYLQKYIEAMSRQIYKDFEVIFCDDGSDDGTKKYFEQLKSLPFSYKYICNKKSKKMKLAKIMNQAIGIARGEYCIFIMGDSFPNQDYIKMLNAHVAPEKVLCGVRVHIHEGRAVDADWRLKKNRIPQYAALIPENPHDVLTGNGLVIPIKAFRECGGWNETFVGYGGEDNELIARLYYKGYLMWSIPEAILYHHWHKEGIESKKHQKLLDKYVKKYNS